MGGGTYVHVFGNDLFKSETVYTVISIFWGCWWALLGKVVKLLSFYKNEHEKASFSKR